MTRRYESLFRAIEENRPGAVFFGGDLFPTAGFMFSSDPDQRQDFVNDYLRTNLTRIKSALKEAYPRIFIILGNDDARVAEAELTGPSSSGLWEYIHGRSVRLDGYTVFGYAFVPPTPFLLKDWEKYDVSRYTDPGSIMPEEGVRTVPVRPLEIRSSTIKTDLDELAGSQNLSRAIFLFHSPPYQTKLDRAALDGKMIDHVPFDVHVGSIAIRRFIEERQPLLTLHGHIHESFRLTGSWKDKIGRTFMFSAGHDGPGLALIRFNPSRLDEATRSLL